MLTPESIIQMLEKNIDKTKGFGVKKIGLFGSHVRNEQTAGSDIDILVEFESGKKNFDNYMDLRFFLADLFSHKVDLVVVDALKPDLKPYILGSVRYASGA